MVNEASIRGRFAAVDRHEGAFAGLVGFAFADENPAKPIRVGLQVPL